MPDQTSNPVGVQSWGDYLAAKAAPAAKAVTADDDTVEDKAVKRAATKGRKAPDAGN